MKEASDCLNELGATNGHIYLGDSVYAGFGRFGDIYLITWNGHSNDPRNKICLGTEVYANLIAWVEHAKAIHAAHVEDEKEKN